MKKIKESPHLIKPLKKGTEKPVKREPAKKVNKKKAKKPDLKNGTRVYHVVKRPEDGKWAVKYAGGEKVIKLFDTQKEAVAYSKEMTKSQDGKMLVHNSKGENKGKIKKTRCH